MMFAQLESMTRNRCVFNAAGVRLLRVGLRLDRIRLHGLGIRDDLLDHAHDAARARGLLVLLEARRRRRARRLLADGLLHEGLLRVHGLQHVQGVRQELLRRALVRDRGLEIRVLRLCSEPFQRCAAELTTQATTAWKKLYVQEMDCHIQ